MNTQEIASRIAEKIYRLDLRDMPRLEATLAAELDKELKPMVEKLERVMFQLEQLQTAVRVRPSASVQAIWCAEAQSWETVAAVRQKELEFYKGERESACKALLMALAGAQHSTPEETYGENIRWATSDACMCITKLRAQLAMATDAASKGDLARQQAGGMEMEIQELKTQLASEQEKARKAVLELHSLLGYLSSLPHALKEERNGAMFILLPQGWPDRLTHYTDKAQATLRELEGLCK